MIKAQQSVYLAVGLFLCAKLSIVPFKNRPHTPILLLSKWKRGSGGRFPSVRPKLNERCLALIAKRASRLIRRETLLLNCDHLYEVRL